MTDTGSNESPWQPVNVAKPQWQCPHCHTDYRDNLEKATECASAGPAPQGEAGQHLLYLSGSHPTTFGLTEVGPVKIDYRGEKRSHYREINLGGLEVRPSRLESAVETTDGLKIIAQAEPENMPVRGRGMSWGSWALPAELFLGPSSFGGYHKTGVPVWLSGMGRSSLSWMKAPDAAQRAALNVVTAGLLDAVADMDISELEGLVRQVNSPEGSRTAPLKGLLVSGSTFAIADAHGAPNEVWALRWLTAHNDAVVTWFAAKLKNWAAGEGGPVPVCSPYAADSLPRNPGKRRLALMEPYGDTYYAVLDAVTSQLVVDAPTNPIPNVPDVETTVRETPEGN